MNVTCLAIGDQHFQVSNVQDCKELITKVNKLVEELSPTFLVLLGDLLHTHEKVHVTPFNLATQFITSLAKKIEVFLLIGNHDYCNNQQFLTNNHPFNSFKKITNVIVCDKVISREFNDIKFVFSPYTPPERFTEALDTLKEDWGDAACIFAHQEFYGCRFNPVMTSTIGDIWPEEFPLVVSGHIHNEQWLQKNIYYTGSSMQHAFGETSKKTVAFLTFEPDKKCKVNKIDLEMKKRKIIYCNIKNVAKFKPVENTYIKLVIDGLPEELQVFRKSQAYKDLVAAGITVSLNPKNTIQTLDYPATLVKRNVMDILKDLVTEPQKIPDKYLSDAYTTLVNMRH